jgi:microcystin-dependent protein
VAIGGIDTEAALRAFIQQTIGPLPTLVRQTQGQGASVGDVKATATSVTGPGWIACDGSALTAASPYQTLRAQLIADGNPFGVSGSDPLLPNPQGRTIIGSGTGAGLTARALGASLGEESHLLLSGESGLPAHEHNYFLPTATNLGGGGTTAINAGANGAQSTTNGTARNAASAHNNMQPSLALKIWIYAGG